MTRLYSLTTQYLEIENQINSSDELSEEHLFLIESVTDDIKEKAINISYIIQNMEAESKAIDEATKNMLMRHIKLSDKINSLKNYLKNNLETCDIKEIKSPHFDIRIKINPPIVKISDESLIPNQYIKETISKSVDKRSICQDIKNDVFVPGVILERHTRIEIK